jgi:hypothetical protein
VHSIFINSALIFMTQDKFLNIHNVVGGMAELAKVSVVHPRDPGSNLGSDRKYFLILFVS